ncbi:MAG: hypothetical protein P1U65_11900 [Minwuia sp.]|nr:hypothetical protein [Minwuia sp.]
MKKLIIIGGLVVLLGGGGAAAFMMLGSKDDQAHVEAAIPELTMDADPVYLRLDGLTAPIMKGTHVRHYIFLNVSIVMVDDSARDDASPLKPRLHDAFLREFYSKTIAKGDGTIDFASVSKRLTRQAKKVLGEDQVVEVLITRAMRGAG